MKGRNTYILSCRVPDGLYNKVQRQAMINNETVNDWLKRITAAAAKYSPANSISTQPDIILGNMRKSTLNTLQLIETGYLDNLPSDMPIWKGTNKKQVNTCAVCGIIEPLIWHHVFSKNVKGKTSTSGKSNSFDFKKLLGVVHICPNCHHLIHQSNPYNKAVS